MAHGELHDDHGTIEHGGPTHAAHRSFLDQILYPLIVPAVAGLVLFGIILAVSQILLAMGGDNATPIALLIAVVVLFGCAYVASAPHISRSQLMLSVAVPAILLGAAGIGARAYRVNHKESKGGTEANAIKPQVATDDVFSVTSYTVAANTPIDIPFSNQGQNIHNMHILGVKDAVTGAEPVTVPQLVQPGTSGDLKFTIADPGTYKFQCDVHPTQMIGQITVTPAGGGAAAAAAGASPAAGAGGPTETTTDNKFSDTSITINHGDKVTMTVDNKGQALHNWDVLDANGQPSLKDTAGNPIKTDFVNPGESKSVTFAIDTPGTYNFQCDVHPTEMKGTLVVK